MCMCTRMGKYRFARQKWHGVCFAAIMMGIVFSTADGCDIGTPSPVDHTANLGGTTDGRVFFISGAASTCCGTMDNWKFYANSPGIVTMMLFRPTTGDNYRLEYMEDHTAVVGLNTPIPSTTVQVEIGDVVSWKTAGAELIPNSAGGGPGTKNQIWTPTLNANVPWGQAADTTNTYAFGAVVEQNVAPTITGGSVTIGDMDTSQTIHPLAITDTDSVDFLVDTTVGITATSPTTTDFSISDDGTNFVINSGASLAVGTYELTVTVEDLCQDKVSATVTVTVENPTPVYDPATPDTTYSGTISDATTAATFIYEFSVIDTDTINCTTDNSKFEIRDVPPNHQIWLKDVATTDLNYDDNSVEGMTISCSDGNTAALRSFSVNIADELPVLSNVAGTTNVGDGTAIGTSVYQFTVDDQDDVIACTSSDPDFTITAVDGAAGTQRFDIETAAVLDAGITPSYTLTVSCNDTVNTPVTDTHTITVSDAAPVFDPTYPDTVYTGTVSDITTTATSLYAFSVIDTDPILCSTDNAKFEIRDAPPNKEIWLKDVATTDLNYDNDAVEVMTISCNDSTTTITRDFNVTISDELPVVDVGVGTAGPIGDLSTIGTTVYQFTVTDQDDSVTCTSSDADFTIFDPGVAGTQILEVVTAAGLNEDTTASYTLTLSCNDGQNVVTDTLIVTVSDEQPTLTGFNITATAIPDGVQGTETTLGSFTVTDANDVGGSLTCSVTTPNDVLFQLTGTAPNFDVKTISGQTLESGSAPYEVEVTCDDDEAGNTVSGTVTVPLTNTAPVFVDMPATLSPNISDATDADTILHSFSVTDTPTATLSCSYTATTPYDDDFDIRGTPPDFEIWLLAANDLNYDIASSVPVTVTCTDTFTDITEDFTVNVYDEDPVWTGFPATAYQYLSDGEPAAVSLFTFSVADSDDTILCAVDQTSPEATHFEIRPQTPPEFQLWYQGSPPASLDFQAASSHNVSIICNDGGPYSKTEVYTVDLENRPPLFTNLPNASPTISESETTKTSLFTVSVSDVTEVYCYLSDTVIAAGIEPLEKGTVALPITEYVVYAWHTTGFDFEARAGTITVDASCGDTVSTITETLTINIQNAAPVITNPGGSSTISEEETGTLTLKTINFEKFDAADATCTMTNNGGGPFDVTNNQIVKTAGALDSATTYNLDISCTDGEFTTTDSYTVTVDNKGPDITNLPSAIDIPEQQYDRLPLLGLTLSEEARDCSQVAPTESEFEVLFEPSTSLWTIYYVGQNAAGKPLSYETKPYYDITVVCTDTSTPGAQGKQKTFTVNVVDNEAPVFTNIGGAVVTKVERTAKDYAATNTLFTVTADDPTNPSDPITYTMLSCEPAATCNFTMTPNGDIVTNVDLHSHPDDVYILSVKAEDEYNPNTAPVDMILKLNDINTPPVFTNVPRKDKVGILENQYAAGDTVFQMSVNDPDTTDTLTYFCDFTDGGDVYYECDSATGAIRTKVDVNLEEMTQQEHFVQVYVNDGYVSSAVQDLTLRVNDENEQPEFSPESITISNPDEGGHKTEIDCLKATFDSDITDEDTSDVYTYTMNCPGGGGVFVMDRLTACVMMLKEWDLDTRPNRRAVDTITCTVTATDKGGLTTTKELIIEINAGDDNQPYLDQTSYVFCATVGTSSGTLGQVTTDDEDVTPDHRTHTFDFSGSGPFGYDGNGGLTYGDVSSYPLGTTFGTTLRVTDEAGNYDEAPVCVMICEAPVAAAAAASASASSTSSSTSDLLLWLIPTILLGLLALGLAAYCLRKCLTGGRLCAKSSPVRAVRAVQPVRVMKAQPVAVRRQLVKKVITPVKVVKTPVKQILTPVQTIVKRTPPQPIQPQPIPPQPIQPLPQPPPKTPKPIQLPFVNDLPMHNFWARDKGNIGDNIPT